MNAEAEGKGILIILSGPSGVGKDTVLERLSLIMPDMYLSISATTRPMRAGEIDGVHYFFVDSDDFEQKIEQDYFLEHANYGGKYYGTPRSVIDEKISAGNVVFLKIEVQGAENIRKIYPDAVSIFLTAPSFDELSNRLSSRSSESSNEITTRIETAKQELARAGEYDYVVVNDSVERCADDIAAIVRAERLRYKYMKDFITERIINNA